MSAQTTQLPAVYDILIIRGDQDGVEKVRVTLGLKFNWFDIPPDWQQIEKALNENPIRVVIIAGGQQDMVCDCTRYAEVKKPGVKIFVVSATPYLLPRVLVGFPHAVIFDTTNTSRSGSSIQGFDQNFGAMIRAYLA